jgi:cytoskeletal protein RodZ
MEHFAAALRTARETRNISLTDIAASTLINIHHLEEMEKGNFSILPQTYIRAFLREYASAIGLDPDETLRNYDGAQKEEHRRRHPEPVSSAQEPREKPGAAALLTPFRDLTTVVKPWLTIVRIRIGLLMLAVIVLGTVLWNTLRTDPSYDVAEVPFQSVVKDNEQRIGPGGEGSRSGTDSKAPEDSLFLTARTIDTVWVQITVDNLEPQDYIFYPNGKMSWSANRRFLVTLGNAGGVEFTLNKKSLGTFGNRGVVVRNLELTRQTLAKP